jgi:hypothetical protein
MKYHSENLQVCYALPFYMFLKFAAIHRNATPAYNECCLCVFMPCHQNGRQNHNINIANKPFETMAEFNIKK